MQPYHTVERQGFKSMVSKLNPKYNLPSRKHFCEKEIPSLYASVKSDVSSKLDEMAFCSATTDLWTSRATHPYLIHCYRIWQRNICLYLELVFLPSERIFSKGGIIVDPFHSHLKPDHVNTLIFLSKNIK